MQTFRRFIKASIGVALARTLLAYLDPGSGSLIVQLLVAAIVGILATFRLWKNRLLRLFGIKPKAEDSDEDLDSDFQDSA